MARSPGPECRPGLGSTAPESLSHGGAHDTRISVSGPSYRGWPGRRVASASQEGKVRHTLRICPWSRPGCWRLRCAGWLPPIVPKITLRCFWPKSLGGHISHVVLKLLDPTGGVLGILRVVTGGKMHDVQRRCGRGAGHGNSLGSADLSWMATPGPGDGRLRGYTGNHRRSFPGSNSSGVSRRIR